MAHFCKINGSKVVERTIVIADSNCVNADNVENDASGQDYINNTLNLSGTWLRTSYNTLRGKYYNTDRTEADDQSKMFRGNYAGIGYTYDESLDAFLPPKPYSDWNLNNSTFSYDPPISFPSVTTYDDSGTEKKYVITWSTSEGTWVASDHNLNDYKWNNSSSAWEPL